MRDALKLDRQADESYRAGYYAGWEDATAAVEGLLRRPWRSIQTICAKFRAHMATALVDWLECRPGELMYPPPFDWGESPVPMIALPAKRRRRIPPVQSEGDDGR